MPASWTTEFAASSATEQSCDLAGVETRTPQPSRLLAEPEFGSPRLTKAAAVAGLNSVGELLALFPTRYREVASETLIDELADGQSATVTAAVESVRGRRAWRNQKLSVVEAKVTDSSGSTTAVWFNQPWLTRELEPGVMLELEGKVGKGNKFNVSRHRVATAASVAEPDPAAGTADGRPELLQPVYPLLTDLPQKTLERVITNIKSSANDAVDPLPSAVRTALGLASLPGAVAAAHSPGSKLQLNTARRRLAFDELLERQLQLARRRHSFSTARAVQLTGDSPVSGPWLENGLPFVLTEDQQRATAVLKQELERGEPMRRLLMGEVGSGKTVVALYALLRALDSGHQAALMAPTETLARQHHLTIGRLLERTPVRQALLTGATPAAAARETLAGVSSGEVGILVGTQALIQERVEFASLAVVVIDEQHRFGVRQRAELASSNSELLAHRLDMTATPIPRTLAFAVYGDIDTTVIRSVPAGRTPVETTVVNTGEARVAAYTRIRSEVAAGRQAFVVCAAIEEEVQAEGQRLVRGVEAEYARLGAVAGPLAGLRLGLMHGRLNTSQKQSVMEAFVNRKLDVLVATTVIEVGVDVPNATVILIENGERFGISQLHQLRGRVGRSTQPGFCFIAGSSRSPRLAAVAQSNDGFELAEQDLAIRGEGDIGGVKQSGNHTFRHAHFPEDAELLAAASRYARDVTTADPTFSEPENALLEWLGSGSLADARPQPEPVAV